MHPMPPRSLKSKKEGHFRGQGIEFDRKMPKYGNWFFAICYAKIERWHNLLYTLPTLGPPCTYNGRRRHVRTSLISPLPTSHFRDGQNNLEEMELTLQKHRPQWWVVSEYPGCNTAELFCQRIWRSHGAVNSFRIPWMVYVLRLLRRDREQKRWKSGKQSKGCRTEDSILLAYYNSRVENTTRENQGDNSIGSKNAWKSTWKYHSQQI